uniref:Peptidase S1 domain-containing protein n=1 Tax=Cynoglossus semilaevis TaxID=244447 RepID=A0A3P8WSD0_CYNSE
ILKLLPVLCGTAPLNTKIVGGENAVDGAWPWQGTIQTLADKRHFCAGTLLNTEWALTAAHCVKGRLAADINIIFGRLAHGAVSATETKTALTEIIIHPEYNATTHDKDIALLKLQTSIVVNNHIQPICLPTTNSQFFTSTLCWATGWGKVNNNDFSLSDNLQEIDIPVVGKKKCSCSYQSTPKTTITDNMICAGGKDKGICLGDGGGPLQCKQDDKWILAGITSIATPCLDGLPQAFTRVSQFQDWILQSMKGFVTGLVPFVSSGTDADLSFVCPADLTTTAKPPLNSNLSTTTTTATTTTTTMTTTTTTTTSPASALTTEFSIIITALLMLLQHIVVQ